MNFYNIIVILFLFINFPNKILTREYVDNNPVFDHGMVEMSSSEFEDDNEYSNSDSIDSYTKYRPTKKPIMSPQWDYERPLTPAGEKINFMKTYFDPITKQPFRYVMRKKIQKQEEDSFFNTASKIINTLLGSSENQSFRPYDNNNAHQIRNFERSARHNIHKREIQVEDNMNKNENKNSVNWIPVQTIKHTKSNEQETATHENADSTIKRRIDLELFSNSKENIEKSPISKNISDEYHSTNNFTIEERNLNGSDTNLEDSKKLPNVENIVDNYELSDTSGFLESVKILQKVFMNCKHKIRNDKNANYILSMQSCIQVSILKAFDRMLLSEYIPLNENVYLVQSVNTQQIKNSSKTWNPLGKDLKSNSDFIAAFCERMFRMLQSHSLQIKLWNSPNEVVEGRRRHHYRKAFPMMVAGYMMLSAFLVPLGFQFMAMIGGKALLLSKMALMMSMLGGFRKLLTPDPIYHALPSYDYHSGATGWHHRSTHEPSSMTSAYTKNNYGGYSALQRDYQQQTQQWIDPKSYTVYSSS